MIGSEEYTGMICDVTLTAQEFSDLHNALWKLGCIGDREVDNIVKMMRDALAGAYMQDEREFERKNALWNSVAETNGFNSLWSIYEAAGPDEEHPFQGAKSLVYRDHTGDVSCRRDIQGNTWQDLYRAADLVIAESGDMHHIFIEAFNRIDDITLELRTGS